MLAERTVGVLAAGGQSLASPNVTIPAGTTPGSYFIIAVSDDDLDQAESVETNNARVRAITITLVARMEERLGTRADARADELRDGQRRLESMLDRLVMLYLLHTPEVAPQLHRGAVVSANRRYGGYWQEVDDRLGRKGREAEVQSCGGSTLGSS